MNRITRSSGIAALALTMSLGVAACGSEDDAASEDTTASETPSMTETPSDDMSDDMSESEDTMSEDPMAGGAPFGAACAEVPTEGEGSVEGMADDPVATAASNNPLLKTLVAAVGKADLVDTLNSAEDITVFAPTDEAFAKIPKKTLNKVLKDKKTLTAILTHHVVGEPLTPENLAGEHDTFNKDMVSVEGSGESFTVMADDQGTQANVICGNVQTANATVYIVDTVLMPSM